MALFPAYEKTADNGVFGASHSNWLQNSSFQAEVVVTGRTINKESTVNSEALETADANSEALETADVKIPKIDPAYSQTCFSKHGRKRKKTRSNERKKTKSKGIPKELKEIGVTQSHADPTAKWKFVVLKPGEFLDNLYQEDAKRDHENLTFESMYKKNVAVYKRNHAGLGSSDIRVFIDKYFPKKKDKRYFSFQRRKTVLDISSTVHTSKEVDIDFLNDDYIQLKPEVDDDGKQLVYDSSIQMYRRVESITVDTVGVSKTRVEANNLNEHLLKNPTDVSGWLRFVNLQDKLHAESSSGTKSQKYGSSSDLVLLERKMSILQKALSHNPNNLKLTLVQLHVGHDGLWEHEKLVKAWERLEFHHVNELEMWEEYLWFFQRELTEFSVQKQIGLYDKCLAKLQHVLSGKLVTHPPQPETEKFILCTLLKKCCFLVDAGCYEKAYGTLQAAIEFNFYQPPQIADLSLQQKRTFFEPFWENNAPKFGEEGSKGWKETSGHETASVSNETIIDSQEDELCERLKSRPLGEVWVNLESARDSSNWLPWRLETEPEDPDRCVLFDEIEHCLIEFSAPCNRFLLLIGCLKLLGANLLPFETADAWVKPHENWDHTAGSKFSCLPELNLLHLKEAEEVIQRIFTAAESLLPDPFSTYFLCSQLCHTTSCKTPDLIPHKEKLKAIRSNAKELLGLEKNRNNVAVYVVYADILIKAKAFKDVINVCKKTLIMVNFAKTNGTDLLSFELHALKLLSLLIHAKVKSGLPVDFMPELIDDVLSVFGPGHMASPGSRANIIMTRKIMFEKLAKIKVNCNSDESHWLITGWLGSRLIFTTAVVAWFEYLLNPTEAGVKSAVSVFDDSFRVLVDSSQSLLDSDSPKYREVRRETELLLMERTIFLQICLERSSVWSYTILNETVSSALAYFPCNFEFLGLFTSLHMRGYQMVYLRRYFDTHRIHAHSKQERKQLTIVWLATINAEFARYKNVVSGANGFLPEVHRLRHVLQQAVESMPHSPVFWRLYMQFEASNGTADDVKKVFFQAIKHCPWAKRLYLDVVRFNPDSVQMVVDLLIEKNLRLRLPLEELELLIRV